MFNMCPLKCFYAVWLRDSAQECQNLENIYSYSVSVLAVVSLRNWVSYFLKCVVLQLVQNCSHAQETLLWVLCSRQRKNLWCVCAQVLNVVTHSCARHSGSFAVWSVDRTTSEPWRPPRLWTQSLNLFSLSVQLKVGPLVNFKRWWSTIFMCVL